MNINEADQTYSLISRTNSDNLMRFSLFSFLQQRAFIFITKKLPLHMIFNLVMMFKPKDTILTGLFCSVVASGTSLFDSFFCFRKFW